jgi:hypothetical protein
MNFPQIEHVRVGFTNGRTFGRVSVPCRCVVIAQPSSPLKRHSTWNRLRLGVQRPRHAARAMSSSPYANVALSSTLDATRRRSSRILGFFALSSSVIISLIFNPISTCFSSAICSLRPNDECSAIPQTLALYELSFNAVFYLKNAASEPWIQFHFGASP